MRSCFPHSGFCSAVASWYNRNMNYHYDKYAKLLLKACGYSYDVLRTDVVLCLPEYALSVYSKTCPEWLPEESYSEACEGQTETSDRSGGTETTWLYGHAGYETLKWYGDESARGDSEVSSLSEYKLWKSFIISGVFAGNAGKLLDAIPGVRSIQELKLWLAVSTR